MTKQNSHTPQLVPLADPDISLEEAEVGENTIEQVEASLVSWIEVPDEMALRAHIFSTPDIREEVVAIPEWSSKILVRGLNAKTRARILTGAMKKDGTPDLEKMYPDLVIATACHPLTKKHIFSPADRDALNEKSGGALEKLAMAAARLSGLDTESQAKAAENF